MEQKGGIDNNSIHDYYNFENERHYIKDKKIMNSNQTFKANNSLNSSDFKSVKIGILKKSNNRCQSVFQNNDNTNNEFKYKLNEDRSLVSFRNVSN